MPTDTSDRDVREFFRVVAEDMPLSGAEQPAAVRLAKRRLLRNAALTAVGLCLAAVAVVSSVLALENSSGERRIPAELSTVQSTAPPSTQAPSTPPARTDSVGAGVIAYANDGIYTINSDGSNPQKVLDCANCSSPVWSPDGREIAYVQAPGVLEGGLYVWGLAGDHSMVVRCHPPTCEARDVAWSPDGRLLAYTNSGPHGTGIDVVDVDGSNPRRISPAGLEAEMPAWSPDGTQIAFAHVGTTGDRIYVMNADGSGLTKILDRPGGSGPGAPSWSPDGKKIAYFNTPRTDRGFVGQVRVMSPDGTDDSLLYQSKCCVEDWRGPAWSPDGTAIAFVIETDPLQPPELMVMDADGSNVTAVTEAWERPSWRPNP